MVSKKSGKLPGNTKGYVEILCSCMIWKLRILITGHEDGCVCLWNVDSGAKIVARGVLKQPVASIASGTTYQNEILLATDICGNIGVWNLSLFKRNPTVVSKCINRRFLGSLEN